MDKFIFDELHKVPVSYQVVSAVRTAISEGKLKKGDKLPSEREFAAQLGISRVPLREGLRILGAYGVVESRPGEGAFITDKFADHVFEFLGIGDLFSKENFLHLMEFRRIIEVNVMEKAIQNITLTKYNELKCLIADLRDASDVAVRTKSDADFHRTIVELSANPIITEVYKMIYSMLTKLISGLIRHDDVHAHTISFHSDILSAIHHGEVDNAKDTLNRHIDDIIHSLAAHGVDS